MTEIEVSYWHMLNLARPAYFRLDPAIFIEKMLITALFAKNHCNGPDVAPVFTTYIKHNFREIMEKHAYEFENFSEESGK